MTLGSDCTHVHERAFRAERVLRSAQGVRQLDKSQVGIAERRTTTDHAGDSEPPFRALIFPVRVLAPLEPPDGTQGAFRDEHWLVVLLSRGHEACQLSDGFRN